MRTSEELVKHNAWVKEHHGKLRRAKRCIGGKKHGRAYKGGRCRRCWRQKLARERAAYKRSRQP